MSFDISNFKKFHPEEIAKQERRIILMLSVLENTVDKENKIKVAIEIYKYLFDLFDNIYFVIHYPSIENIVIDKCYQFKSEYPEEKEFLHYLDRFLIKINKPLSVRRSKRIANNPRVKYY